RSDGRHEAARVRRGHPRAQHRYGRAGVCAGRVPGRAGPAHRGLFRRRLHLHQRRFHRHGRGMAGGQGRFGARRQDRAARVPHPRQHALRHAVCGEWEPRMIITGKIRRLLAVLACLGMLAAGIAPAQPGPATDDVDLERYRTIVYVSASGGRDAARGGTKERPWASIGYALDRIDRSARPVAVLVAAGLYEEHGIEMAEQVDLYGGYDPETWARDVWKHRTILDGGERGRVLVAADRSRLDGFEVTGGVVRGKGAGILVDGVSPVLSNNF